MTQDEFNVIRNHYFVLNTGADWYEGLSTAPEDTVGVQEYVKPRIGSMSQFDQDTLLALFDEMVTEIAALS